MLEGGDQAASLRRQPQAPKLGGLKSLQSKRALCCLSVASGKGGVGKTFLASNLALAFCALNRRVLLVDADLGLANADIVLGVHTEFSIQDAIFKGIPLRNVVTSTPYGLDLLAASSGAKEMVSLGEARMTSFIKELVSFASEYDVLIFDCAAGIDSAVTSFIAAAPQTLIVATSQPTSVMDVYALMKIIHQDRLSNNVGLVVNMVASDEQGKMVASALGKVSERFLSRPMELLGVIPATDLASRALQLRRPFLLEFPDDPAAERIRALAKGIVQRQSAKTSASGLDGAKLLGGLMKDGGMPPSQQAST